MPVWYFDTDIGRMGLAAQNGAVTRLYFRIEEAALTEETTPIPDEPTGFHKKVERQIKEYLAGKRREFTLPVEPEEGTPFMKRVWEALRSVPFGQTISYGQLAAAAGRPGAARAVGQAMNRNPVPILIPCHRVIGANGDLVGFGGGMDLKCRLLTLEGVALNGQRIRSGKHVGKSNKNGVILHESANTQRQ